MAQEPEDISTNSGQPEHKEAEMLEDNNLEGFRNTMCVYCRHFHKIKMTLRRQKQQTSPCIKSNPISKVNWSNLESPLTLACYASLAFNLSCLEPESCLQLGCCLQLDACLQSGSCLQSNTCLQLGSCLQPNACLQLGPCPQPNV